MTRERVPWVRPIFEVDDGLFAEIRAALATGRVTRRPVLREFERRFARYSASTTASWCRRERRALFLAVWALGLSGSKAVCPRSRSSATLNAMVHSGMTPVFCDIDPDTWTISPAHLDTAAGRRSGDPPGRPGERIRRAARSDGIERAMRGPASHCCSTTRTGSARSNGVHSRASRSSRPTAFTPRRSCPPSRVARRRADAAAARRAAAAPQPRVRRRSAESTLGYNAKMSELHAAVGLRSLRGLDAALARRRQYAERMRRGIADHCGGMFTAQRVPAGVVSNFQNLGVLCRLPRCDVAAIQAELDRDGIETRRYFWPPLHQLPAYRGRCTLPVTDEVCRAMLCLPLHSRMDKSTFDRIESALRRCAATFAA